MTHLAKVILSAVEQTEDSKRYDLREALLLMPVLPAQQSAERYHVRAHLKRGGWYTSRVIYAGDNVYTSAQSIVAAGERCSAWFSHYELVAG